MGQDIVKGLVLRAPSQSGCCQCVLCANTGARPLYYLVFAGVVCRGSGVQSDTVTQILVNLSFTSVPVVTPAKFLITLNFLSEEASGVFVTELTFVPGLYLPVFQTLLSVGRFATAGGCWKQSQQAPDFLGKN